MLTVTLFLLETVQGRKGAPHTVCIRPKPEEKVLKVFWIHLQTKISAAKFFRALFLLSAGWHSLCFSLALPTGKLTLPQAPSPTGLVGFWCRVSVCVPEWYHAQSSGVSNPNNAVGSALFVWTCTECNQGSSGWRTWELRRRVTGRIMALPLFVTRDEAAYVQNGCLIILRKI